MQENEASNTSPKAIIEGLLNAFMRKDLPAIMAYFADDAVLYDPHYPQPRMVGKEAIQQGIAWGLSTLEKPGFTIRQVWIDGNSGVAETDTHHVIRGSITSKMDQVFVFEVRDGKLTRLQSYVPYPPHGIAGVIGTVTKVMWRLQGKIK